MPSRRGARRCWRDGRRRRSDADRPSRRDEADAPSVRDGHRDDPNPSRCQPSWTAWPRPSLQSGHRGHGHDRGRRPADWRTAGCLGCCCWTGASATWRIGAISPTRAVTAGGGRAVTLLRGDLDRGLAHHLRDVATLGGHRHRDDVTGRTGTRGAARAVQVRLVLGGRVDVHDELDVVDVHTAGGDVGGDEDEGLAGGELREVALAGTLRQVALQVDGRDALAGELLGQALGVVLRAHEEDAATGARGEGLGRGPSCASASATSNTWWVIASTGLFASSTECITGLCRNFLTSLSTPLSSVAENSSALPVARASPA